MDIEYLNAASPIDAALWYAEQGWPVYPLNPSFPGPVGTGNNPGFVGSRDPDRIRAWFDRYPGARVAIKTGMKAGATVDGSGLVVIGVRGPAGLARLQALEGQHGPLSDTLKATAGPDGFDLYFRFPDGCSAVHSDGYGLGRGLSVHGDCYGVTAPPSVYGGRKWLWTNDQDPADLPSWLTGLIGDTTVRWYREHGPSKPVRPSVSRLMRLAERL